MENLFVAGTRSTPAIFFNIEKGILTLTGNSYPEDSVRFYDELENVLNYYIKNHSDIKLIITCEFVYINTSSTKSVFNLLKTAVRNLDDVTVIWGYEEDDDDIRELGEDFSETLDISFEYRVFAE